MLNVEERKWKRVCEMFWWFFIFFELLMLFLPHKTFFWCWLFVLNIQTDFSSSIHTNSLFNICLVNHSKNVRHYPPSSLMSVHTRKKIWFGVAVDVMISCWLLYASLEMNEEERGVKLLNNLILVPFFCIINSICTVLHTNNSRKGGKCGSKST